MGKSLLSLTLALLLAASATGARGEDANALAAAIDRVAQAAIDSGETPGLQVAVYKDGSPLLVKSYGRASLELDVPVTDDTVFRIGSVTKQFTAVALLQLQEEGKLSLTDRLDRYYPDYPRARDITLDQMLHHTSGLHSYTSDESFSRDKALRKTTGQWVEHFARMPETQDFEPGTSWSYSNTGYFLLGGVVEQVEGKPLAKVFEERFFKRLGMSRTALDDEHDIVPGRAAGYGVDAEGRFRNPDFISMSVAGAAGAMRSTASDLARWNRALFGGELLSAASFRAMTTPGRLDDGRLSSSAIENESTLAGGEYGYGLVIAELDGHPWLGHAGGIDGFSSSLAEFPRDRTTVAVLGNSVGPGKGAFQVAARIQHIAIGAEAEPDRDR